MTKVISRIKFTTQRHSIVGENAQYGSVNQKSQFLECQKVDYYIPLLKIMSIINLIRTVLRERLFAFLIGKFFLITHLTVPKSNIFLFVYQNKLLK